MKIKNMTGYAVSFTLGAAIASLITLHFNPYTLALWTGAYKHATLGSLIASNKNTLQTGQIPQDILDWYAENKGE